MSIYRNLLEQYAEKIAEYAREQEDLATHLPNSVKGTQARIIRDANWITDWRFTDHETALLAVMGDCLYLLGQREGDEQR